MIRRITKERPLKILGFTDMHLDDKPGCCRMTMKLLRETIEGEGPDLVVFVGDTVTGGENLARVQAFTALMTEMGVPWAPAIGNHEGDNPASVSREEMTRLFRKSPLCLMPDAPARLSDGGKVWGAANYSVPLYNDEGRMVHRLIFLDGGSDMSREDMVKFGWGSREKPYDDYLKESQIAWYRETVRADECPSMVFCHIPLPEFREAAERGELISGGNHERICCCPHNSGMFDAMLEEGRTIAFAAGHDHVNDSHYLYKGIRLIYNRMSGLSSYNAVSEGKADRLMQGCSVYYIHSDGHVTFGDIFYEDRFPQHHDEIYAVIRTRDKQSS